MDIPKATDGVLEVTLDHWEDLFPYIREFSELQIYIFRGQGNSEWPLTTTLNRFYNTLHNPEHYKQEVFYYIHLENFIDSLRGRGVNTKGLSHNELWALGQHYGLFTPLLDWTTSFYIALHFAFIGDAKPESGYRSVYALCADTKLFTHKMYEYNKNKEEYDRFQIVNSTSDDNPRVINQAGLFTRLPFDFDIEQWTRESFRDEHFRFFIKINISETQRRRVLRELNLMNINPKVIFPDLQGSALNCNFQLYLMADRKKSLK